MHYNLNTMKYRYILGYLSMKVYVNIVTKSLYLEVKYEE